MTAGWLKSTRAGDRLTVTAGGSWDLAALGPLDAALKAIAVERAASVLIDGAAIERLDTAGAWVLHRTRQALIDRGVAAEITGLGADQAALLARIVRAELGVPAEPERIPAGQAVLIRLGRATIAAGAEGVALLGFIGATTLRLAQIALRPRRLRFTSVVSHLEQTGLNAMPIVGLLAFLIGVVLSYQGAVQLRRFGAEIFTVNLLGISILREMAVVLTAIVVAGRSGSAFTAQIGTMQVNEEVDAMRALGLDPIELLVIPRMIALTIALPLLTVFAELMALMGGALMAAIALDISVSQFIDRLRGAVTVTTFWVGIVKAPVFGSLIALTGCREGLKVKGSAESVGQQTTKSVVIGIFLVIVTDAIFSIIFSYIGV